MTQKCSKDDHGHDDYGDDDDDDNDDNDDDDYDDDDPQRTFQSMSSHAQSTLPQAQLSPQSRAN